MRTCRSGSGKGDSLNTMKFRAWDNKNQNWLTDYKTCYLSEHGDVMTLDYVLGVETVMRFKDAVPEFFIGIADINLQDIYEGDIVQVDEKTIFRIEWRGAGFWFVDMEEGDCLFFDPRVYKLEVIGNIHEIGDFQKVKIVEAGESTKGLK